MPLTPIQTLIMIFAVALGTMVTRFTPFLLFPDGKKQSKLISYLGEKLPPAMMGLLVVYCLKDVNLFSSPYGIPEAVAIICIIGLHLWKRNVFLSISLGTIVYMMLLHLIG